MDYEGNRRWSAKITVTDNYMNLCGRPMRGETVEAEAPECDLQKYMMEAARLEAAKFLLLGLGTHAYVQLFKTTKSHGTVEDHTGFSIDVQDAMAIARREINKPSWRR